MSLPALRRQWYAETHGVSDHSWYRLLDLWLGRPAVRLASKRAAPRVQSVVHQLIGLQKRIEAADGPIVSELHPRYIEGDGFLCTHHPQYFSRWHVANLTVRVDEAPYQPRAGEPVDFGTRSSDPFQNGSFTTVKC